MLPSTPQADYSRMRLFDDSGHRLYLNLEERDAFARASVDFPREVRTFCLTLLYTGCRQTEALELTVDRVDVSAKTLMFESLKKRKRGVFRSVPVPQSLLDALDMTHDLKRLKRRKNKGEGVRLWSWEQKTAWRKVHSVMKAAGIEGAQASAKGLRHGFGVACVEKQIPLNLISKWLGHASLATTAIYANAVGEEERNIAARLWE